MKRGILAAGTIAAIIAGIVNAIKQNPAPLLRVSVRSLPAVDGRICLMRQMLQMPLRNSKPGLSDYICCLTDHLFCFPEWSCDFKIFRFCKLTLRHTADMMRRYMKFPAQDTIVSEESFTCFYLRRKLWRPGIVFTCFLLNLCFSQVFIL